MKVEFVGGPIDGQVYELDEIIHEFRVPIPHIDPRGIIFSDYSDLDLDETLTYHIAIYRFDKLNNKYFFKCREKV